MTYLEGVFVIKLLQEFKSMTRFTLFFAVPVQAVHKYKDVPGC